jgi:Rrf2 family transcriptional regulator, nitric oxide-sensitive transcriptional repressor
MPYSKQVQYALQVLLELEKSPKIYLTVKEIANSRNLPLPFLQKISQSLTRGGIIEAKRGKNGGIKLNGASTRITVMDIINTLEGKSYHDCIIADKKCMPKKLCYVCNNFSQYLDIYYKTPVKTLLIAE